MAIQSSGNKDLFTQINITPLTDIFLVLLIIMMVIAPMFQAVDKNIVLPSINSGLSVDNKQITVAVTKDSQFYVDNNYVTESQLADKLSELLPKSKEKKLVVKADAKTKTKYIMSVMRAAQAAGYEKLTVAGEPLSKKQQTELKDNNKTISNNPNTKENLDENRQPVNIPQ